MKLIPYTYCTIRYIHDVVAGEQMNVGILLYAPGMSFVSLKMERKYERLSHAFADFDGQAFHRVLDRFNSAICRLQEEWGPRLIDEVAPPEDAGQLGRSVWADPDVSFQIGTTRSGVAPDLDEAAEHLFQRLVASQQPRHGEEGRPDEAVWTAHRSQLRAVSSYLRDKTFEAPDFSLTFDHAYQNARWHVIQPLSFDLARGESIQRKATTWLGNSVVLHRHGEFGQIHFILGAPHFENLGRSYAKAKDLLHRTPARHQIIEEDEIPDFASHLEAEMRQHGVIPPDRTPSRG